MTNLHSDESLHALTFGEAATFACQVPSFTSAALLESPLKRASQRASCKCPRPSRAHGPCAMLGRKPKGDAASKPSAVASKKSTASTKKRKWQEELSEESDGEAEQITEKREQMEKDEQERIAREEERRRREAEEETRRKREEEEAKARKEAEEARKAAEEAEQERRRQEEDLIPPGLKPDKAHLYKTSFCKRWEQGNCNFGSACHFAHGERELRGRMPSQGLGLGCLGNPSAPLRPAGGVSLGPSVPVSPPRSAVSVVSVVHSLTVRPMGKGDWKGGVLSKGKVGELGKGKGGAWGHDDWGDWDWGSSASASASGAWGCGAGASCACAGCGSVSGCACGGCGCVGCVGYGGTGCGAGCAAGCSGCGMSEGDWAADWTGGGQADLVGCGSEWG
eukprot:s340_g26.t1